MSAAGIGGQERLTIRTLIEENDDRTLLESFRGWLMTVANRYPPVMPSRVEEIAQEGWIAIWRGAQVLKVRDRDTWPDDVSQWLKRCAVNRMNTIASSWKRRRDDVYMTRLVDFNAAYEDDAWASYLASVALTTDLGEVEWAYHHGEILQAVNRLPRSQKAYVQRRFWNNWAPTALDIYFTNAKETWRSARNNLRRELAYLAEENEVTA